MKPLFFEYIPFYGMIKYFQRYFKVEKRTAIEAKSATIFEAYQLFITLMVGAIIFHLFHP